MKKVRDSSGANYSFHKETAKPQGNFAPVVIFFFFFLLIYKS